MASEGLFRRILSSLEKDGKKYYKLYFVINRDVLDHLIDIIDVYGDVDKAIENAIKLAHEKILGFPSVERDKLLSAPEVDKDLSELKDMIRRLEKRIKEAVSEIISRGYSYATATPEVQVKAKRRTDDSIELPDLIVADEPDATKDEAVLSLEDAITQAIVVAIDEELKDFMGKKEDKK